MPKMIDINAIMPTELHRVIFGAYDNLAPGESFLLIADRDPILLHAQFAAQLRGQYSWNYVEKGPATWQVEIGRVPDAARAATAGIREKQNAYR